ncbi:MAG: CoA-binding protein [Alkalinema sp. CACIAM 70d]|nr:MAG: CoA-binding protein [Alkalinema sp. CACIAM 70d]
MIFPPTSQVIIQGITEPLGMTYAPLMKAYGTHIVAGVSPGAGGGTVAGIPIYDMVEQIPAISRGISTTVICTHPYAALDAALEAIRAGIRQIILISQGIPPLDMVHLVRQAEATETLVVGPNGPGVIVPGQISLGIHPPDFYMPGNVGLITRNGPLTYEIARTLTRAGIGQSIGVSIGCDAIVGSTFPQWLQILEEDDQTEVIVLVGEIGGDSEERAAHYISEAIDKPVIAYIAGHTAPRNRRIGHAGAIIESRTFDFGPDIGTAESKVAAFKRAGVPVAERPSQIPDLVHKLLKRSPSNLQAS